MHNGKISLPTIPPGFALVSALSAIAAALLVNSSASKLTPTRNGVTYAKEECKYFDRESIKGHINRLKLNLFRCHQYLQQTDTTASSAFPAVAVVGIKYLPQNLLWPNDGAATVPPTATSPAMAAAFVVPPTIYKCIWCITKITR